MNIKYVVEKCQRDETPVDEEYTQNNQSKLKKNPEKDKPKKHTTFKLLQGPSNQWSPSPQFLFVPNIWRHNSKNIRTMFSKYFSMFLFSCELFFGKRTKQAKNLFYFQKPKRFFTKERSKLRTEELRQTKQIKQQKLPISHGKWKQELRKRESSYGASREAHNPREQGSTKPYQFNPFSNYF